MTRRALTPAKKKRIAHHRHWRAPEGEPLALENGKVVLLSTGKAPEYDHAVQLALGGADEVGNMQPLTPAQHAAKTKRDAQARGKVRRLSGQTKKRKYYWPKRPFGIPGLRKKFDGTVVKV